MGLPKIDWTKLSDAERLQLLDEAWESFRSAPESLHLTSAQAQEIDRRQAAYEDGSMGSRSWHLVRDEIRNRIRHATRQAVLMSQP